MASNGVGPQVLPTTHDTKHKSQNTKLESQKVETQNTKPKTPLHKTQCPNGDKLKEKVVNKNRTIVRVSHIAIFIASFYVSSAV